MRLLLQKHRKIVLLGKLSISLGLIAYLIRLVDWDRAIQAIYNAPRHFIFTALCISLARLVFASWRIQVILADSNVVFSYWHAFSGYLLSMFYGIFLPGVVGGDVIRIGRCALQTRCQVGTAAVGVLVERISGVFALLGFLFLAYLFYPSTVIPMIDFEDTLLMMVTATIGMIGMTVFLIWRRLWSQILHRHTKNKGICSFFHTAMRTLETLRASTLGLVLLLSGLFQAADIIMIFLLSRALRLDLPLIVFFAAIPLVYVATLLPISLGGLGIREGTLVFLLAQYGIAASDAAMLSFLTYLSYVFVGSVGGIVQLVETLYIKKANVPPLAGPRSGMDRK